MVLAWLLTLPAAGVVGALMWWLGDLLGGYAGPLAIFVVLVGLAAFMYLRSQLPAGAPRQRQRRVDRHARRRRRKQEVPA